VARQDWPELCNSGGLIPRLRATLRIIGCGVVHLPIMLSALRYAFAVFVSQSRVEWEKSARKSRFHG